MCFKTNVWAVSSPAYVFSYYFCLLVCVLPFHKGDSRGNVRGFLVSRDSCSRKPNTQRTNCWTVFPNLQLIKIVPVSASAMLKGFYLSVKCLEFMYRSISICLYLTFIFPQMHVRNSIQSFKITLIELIIRFVTSFYFKVQIISCHFPPRVITPQQRLSVFTWSTLLC